MDKVPEHRPLSEPKTVRDKRQHPFRTDGGKNAVGLVLPGKIWLNKVKINTRETCTNVRLITVTIAERTVNQYPSVHFLYVREYKGPTTQLCDIVYEEEFFFSGEIFKLSWTSIKM